MWFKTTLPWNSSLWIVGWDWFKLPQYPKLHSHFSLDAGATRLRSDVVFMTLIGKFTGIEAFVAYIKESRQYFDLDPEDIFISRYAIKLSFTIGSITVYVLLVFNGYIHSITNCAMMRMWREFTDDSAVVRF